MKDAKILVLGAAYKPDVGDIRESPAVKIINLLHRRGALLAFHDPYVEDDPAERRHHAADGAHDRRSARADLVAVLTPHSAYDLDWVAEHAKLVFDARNAFGPEPGRTWCGCERRGRAPLPALDRGPQPRRRVERPGDDAGRRRHPRAVGRRDGGMGPRRRSSGW